MGHIDFLVHLHRRVPKPSSFHIFSYNQMEKNGIKRNLSLLGQLLSDGFSELIPQPPSHYRPGVPQRLLCPGLSCALGKSHETSIEKHQTIIAHHEKYIIIYTCIIMYINKCHQRITSTWSWWCLFIYMLVTKYTHHLSDWMTLISVAWHPSQGAWTTSASAATLNWQVSSESGGMVVQRIDVWCFFFCVSAHLHWIIIEYYRL